MVWFSAPDNSEFLGDPLPRKARQPKVHLATEVSVEASLPWEDVSSWECGSQTSRNSSRSSTSDNAANGHVANINKFHDRMELIRRLNKRRRNNSTCRESGRTEQWTCQPLYVGVSTFPEMKEMSPKSVGGENVPFWNSAVVHDSPLMTDRSGSEVDKKPLKTRKCAWNLTYVRKNDWPEAHQMHEGDAII
ncbi:T. brucei spp.-specific protein [Trypanosoma brucei gambiense DAL972]|uniref:T. brucei spp.-specific protein n=1 Tax=Trypanosoma brucei gambiense (strain MHOM/CI/86/DAL972) TaxID=679716 RepID=C9ZI61_TRYB9|nr:T. brucei spp.-specific protein [Trypanosoma brucei gambiense DAL972]CBH08853.1 T. brucei spp.-specific protein [Trypanosoma brucei gambiense DAL972]|eukprot:XP_011771294.1 T. brucei spp.-specific protein [Trypanosoma brucei gambiense DAL972]